MHDTIMRFFLDLLLNQKPFYQNIMEPQRGVAQMKCKTKPTLFWGGGEKEKMFTNGILLIMEQKYRGFLFNNVRFMYSVK